MTTDIIAKAKEYAESHKISEALMARIPSPAYEYYGDEVISTAVAALLAGANILLVGSKSTGKNILAENLAKLFGRPCWNISFHVNMDAATMVGMDTFRNNQVEFRPGPIYQVARHGGFAILDEINMAKNEALAVLHSVLDYRRIIDIPGYDLIKIAPEARFIGTMNYGYAGTRELNEALLSRFVVIQMPIISEDNLVALICGNFPNINKKYAEQFAKLFKELQKKAENSEISEKAIDIRGLLFAISLMREGIPSNVAFDLGITNKTFSQYEKALIKDAIKARLEDNINIKDVFD